MESGRKAPIRLMWSDAWLLHAIALAAGDDWASLAKIIEVGDAMEHAIFTYPEIQGGLGRLLAGSLIEVQSQTFRPTPRFAQFLGEITKRRRSSLEATREAIRKYLRAEPWTAAYDPMKEEPEWSFAGVSSSDYDAAFAEYQQRAEDALRRIRSRR